MAIEKTENKEYHLVKIANGKSYPLAFPSQLYLLNGEREYTNVLKCAKHYDTKKIGYNSKNRYARLLMIRIIRIYFELMFNDLLYSMRTVELPFKQTRFFLKLAIKKHSKYKFLYDSNLIGDNVCFKIFWYSPGTGNRFVANMIPTNSFKEKIKRAYRDGIRYNTKNAEYEQ